MKKGIFKSFVYTTALALSLSSFSLGADAAATQKSTEQRELAKVYGDINLSSKKSTTVIVELKEESIVEAKQAGISQSKGNLKKARDSAKAKTKKAVKNAKINREYEYVFSGFSVELPASEVPKLLTLEEVKAVYPNIEYQTDHVEGKERVLSTEEYSPQMLKSAPYIGANRAWETGYKGEGIKVAVIDTGADYTHPDLAGSFGDYKGYDFVDDDNEPQETPKGDPRGEETAHGTHVSGTVAANGYIKGIAPEATLLAYRVLGPGGSGTTEDVVAAIERAVQDGADVMNLSLGNTLNSPDWATSIALDWAMAEGVVAVTSNGNSGPENWTVGSPGTSREAISVGATQLPYNVYSAKFAGYESAKVMGFADDQELLDLSGKEVELVNAGLGQPADFEGINVDGKVAVISRGGIPFVDKATNAKNAGAIGAVIYNNIPGEFEFEIPGMEVPTVKLSNEDGRRLARAIEAGDNKTTFKFAFVKTINETMADFSSRGPVVDTWMIKPDVSAPGVNIVSTVPTHDAANPHGYASYQGTSMASPHVAGTAALLLEANPKWSVEDVKAALMNTAHNLKDPDGNLYPLNTQGAGSIRVPDAINVDTLVAPGSHSFGVFSKKKGKQTEKQHFQVKNLSNQKKKYTVDVQFKGENAKRGIKVKTSKNVKINAKSSKKVNLRVQVDASKLTPGYYEGTIVLKDGKKVVTEVPTILFVQEPDYPRVTSPYVTPAGNNNFNIEAYFPGGAEDVVLYLVNSNFEIVGETSRHQNVSKGLQSFTWNGKIGSLPVAKGEYYFYISATKKGVTDYALTPEPFTVE
ncbi:S8 family peptidase [Metabacillus arenae]|uniref:S8 family serine peptidase n=1 Tax=Metabacillus arenae TaxID=2771434 RepID=A0A926RX34_9BACI|nr:S8 family serine peptidase [Metabacillus arenae]MBD1379742.1 S8 family serine peptidase [Metabacillus arenae]